MDEDKKRVFVAMLKRQREEALNRTAESKRKKIEERSKKRRLNKVEINKSKECDVTDECLQKETTDGRQKYLVLTKTSNKAEEATKNKRKENNENKSQQNYSFKIKIKNSLGAKEKMQRYRQKITSEKRELVRAKDRDRKKKSRQEGKILTIKQMTKSDKKKQRKKWKTYQQNFRTKKRNLQAVTENTPPCSDVDDEDEDLVQVEENNLRQVGQEEIEQENIAEHPLEQDKLRRNLRRKVLQDDQRLKNDTLNLTQEQNIEARNIKVPAVHQKLSGKSRSQQNLTKLRRQLESARKQIESLKKSKEKYKKRLQRMKIQERN